MKNLTLEGRIDVFKTLAILEIVFLALLTKTPHQVVKGLEKIQKSFLWKDSIPKIRHETTCKDYKDGGLKNVDISYKIVNLQCSWIQSLYDDNFYEWKLIPLHLIAMSFGSEFKFYSNVFLKKHHFKNFYCSKEIFLLIERHIFLQFLKAQLAFFRNVYGLTSILNQHILPTLAPQTALLGFGVTTQITMNPL